MNSGNSAMKCCDQQWKTASVSQRGTSHVKTGQPCQDAYRVAEAGGIWLVGAIADGAGSAKWAHVGAQTAAARAVDAVAEALDNGSAPETEEAWEELLARAFRAARQALEHEAQSREVPLADLATTLVLFVCGGGMLAAGQVGDGAVVVEMADGSFETCLVPEKGEYANQTRFLTGENALPLLRTVPTDVLSVTAFTDGLEHLALRMPDGVPFLPFFSPLANLIKSPADIGEIEEEVAALLVSPRVLERTNDDLTLLIAAPMRV